MGTAKLLRRRALAVLVSVIMGCATFIPTASCSGDDGGQTATTPVTRRTIPPASSLPAGFPADFPLVQGSRVTAAETRADGFVVDLQADAEAGDVTAFYQAALAAPPWQTLDVQAAAAGVTIFEFTGEEFDGTLTVAPVLGFTRLLLNLRARQ